MVQSRVALLYQELIRKKFLEAIVFSDIPGPEDVNVLDVFMIPDDALGKFDDFVYSELRLEADKRGLPWVIFLSHKASDTRKFYPHIKVESAVLTIVHKPEIKNFNVVNEILNTTHSKSAVPLALPILAKTYVESGARAFSGKHLDQCALKALYPSKRAQWNSVLAGIESSSISIEIENELIAV